MYLYYIGKPFLLGLSESIVHIKVDFLNSLGRLALFGGQKKFIKKFINLIPLSPRKKAWNLLF